jgi:isopentenyl diphosphate isomerase/L-lactate dehydrogenase-like FMN-dependent dehydrogenase
MEHFRNELVRAMQLTGTPSLKDATPDLLAPHDLIFRKPVR